MYPYPQNYPQYQAYMPQANQPSQNIQQTVQPIVQQPTVIWITDENIVKNFPLAPGGSQIFMNESEPFMYMKTADQFGKTSVIKKRLVDETPQINNELADFIRREEIDNLLDKKVREIVEKRMSEISFKPTKQKKTVVEDEE